MRPIPTLALALTATLSLDSALGEDFATRVSMEEKSAATFYVPGEISGYGPVELMVDTGSGYSTINEATLAVLQREGAVHYVKQLRGVLADGSEMVVPVYAIKQMSIGGSCWMHNVEAAVFPGKSRQILGLSALRKAAPFIFSVDPPALVLSSCGSVPVSKAPPQPLPDPRTAAAAATR
jgi:predicted aspartyl protease